MEQRSQANTVGLDHTHKVQCIMQRTFRTIMFRRGSLAKGSDGHRHHPSTRAEERCEANYFQQTTAMLKCKFDKFRAPHTLHKWTDCAHEVCICQKGKEEGFKDSYLHAASAASCPFASWERHHHADTTRTQQGTYVKHQQASQHFKRSVRAAAENFCLCEVLLLDRQGERPIAGHSSASL
ncbi:uncharacterized protein LOC133658589 isoform X3 [Entelurus aequoreus]|uniref:uncharacterized protein LOC133658589 isoform X3 n=1 Tax=Entelurus aequoreus TaxID=161455 RepID=UPI002B1D22A5|nr:uncharacterized protein LOC133658589 isoform X3 [Entelurus aequoreus]